jgi:hypothetical protein
MDRDKNIYPPPGKMPGFQIPGAVPDEGANPTPPDSHGPRAGKSAKPVVPISPDHQRPDHPGQELPCDFTLKKSGK